MSCFCWPLWKEQPLTLGDVWVQGKDVWWIRQLLLLEHCSLFLAESLMGLSFRPNLGHEPSTGVQESTSVIIVNRSNAKTESIASNLINFFFVCQFCTSGHSIISTESEHNSKQSTSVAVPFCHCGRVHFKLRRSSQLPARKALPY